MEEPHKHLPKQEAEQRAYTARDHYLRLQY